MSLADLIRRHATDLFRQSVTVEVSASSSFIVKVGDFLAAEESTRTESTTLRSQASLYLPVPAAGLPFEPAPGQRIIDGSGSRWQVTSATPVAVRGVVTGFSLDLARIK